MIGVQVSARVRELCGRSPVDVFAAVIPTYQREATILRAVESVLAQTYPPSELIVVDDGSTDRTQERLHELGDLVRIIAQPQSGSAAARNRGVTEATSEWIAFLDSDDRWDTQHLERMAAAIGATGGGADLYFADTEVAFEMFDRDQTHVHIGSLWELSQIPFTDTATLVSDGSSWVLNPLQPMMIQSSVVRRSRYLHEGGMWPLLRLRHDTHLFFKLGLRGSVCAVAGLGAIMSDDATVDRLTRDVTPSSRQYWEETVLLYDDLARRSPRGGYARRVFDERLATAHWRLAKLALTDERDRRATIRSLVATFRVRPSYIPGRVITHLLHGARQ
jgi:glycosyltransferase involved in cell wall biosynthesis